MSIVKKLTISFFLIAFIVSLAGFVSGYVVDGYVVEIVERESPKVRSALVMETEVQEASKSILNYVTRQNPEDKVWFRNNVSEIEKYKELYATKIRTQEEISALKNLETVLIDFKNLGQTIFSIEDELIAKVTLRDKLVRDAIEKNLNDLLQNRLTKGSPGFAKNQEILLQMTKSIDNLLADARWYQINQDSNTIISINGHIQSFEDWQKDSISSLNSEEQIKLMNSINRDFSKVKILTQEIIELEDKKQKIILEFNDKSREFVEVLENKVQNVALNNMKNDEDAVIQSVFYMYLFLFLVMVLATISGFILSRRMTSHLTRLNEVTKKISEGHLDVDINIHSKDEVGQLADAFRGLIDNSKSLVLAARSIGSGDFSVDIKTRSDKDELSDALLNMKNNLKTLTQKNEEQYWMQSQLARIAGLSQGIQDLKMLMQSMISELATSVDAAQGAFYIKETIDAESKKYKLKLLASYAYKKRKQISNEFLEGEGLVGQCALELSTIVLTDVPKDYIEISSGLGSASPVNLIVLPVMFENSLLGVIEIASFHTFTSIQQSFLSEVASSIGLSVNNVMSRNHTEFLLQQSQQLSEELEAQQEELRVSNEELEEKTRVLQTSEEELKVQSEELQVTNEELKEKTDYLEKQKSEIEEKTEEVKKSRDDLEKKAKQLELASKYKSEFLANMSHELRTPLNSLLILSNCFAKNEDGNLNESQIEEAKVIHDSGKNLLNLINEILDLSKVESGKLSINLESVSVKSLAEDLETQFEGIRKIKEVDFVKIVEEDVPEEIESDSQRLKQILMNLLSNAFKFTNQGSVTLEVKKAGQEVTYQNKKLSKENCLAFSVIDTGIGISSDKQDFIFEAFQQEDGSTSRNYGGTGLGLTISREMSRLLGGEIQVKSKKDEGSVFTLYLPVSALKEVKEYAEFGTGIDLTGFKMDKMQINNEHKEIVQEKVIEIVSDHPSEIEVFLADDRETLKSDGKSILIVEDDKKFAQLLVNLAKKKDYQALVAGDGESALALARKYVPKGIILDLGLPDMNGVQVLEQLKFDLSTRHIPVHIISGRDGDIHERMKGAIGYLNKPVSTDAIDDIFDKIESMSESGVKKVLVVEDDKGSQHSILRLIKNDNTEISIANTGKEAFKQIISKKFDCVILDLNLPDVHGIEWLKKLSKEKLGHKPPVIVYTAQELSEKEHQELQQHSSSVVVKTSDSPDRLLDEVSLFLHSVESSLPEGQKKLIQALHDPEKILENRKILLVDDDMRNVFALTKVFQNQGVEVVIASNGQLALDKLNKENNVELVIMDIMMPVMDGYQAMGEIRKNNKFKNLPVIALTAKAMAEERNKCLQAGANDYMTKPIDADKLISMVKVWLYKKK